MAACVRATFLGVTSLVLSDDETCLLTDGFFTRPRLARVAFTRLRSDPAAVQRGLQQAGLRHLDALLVGHSHYDHALDAALVAHLTRSPLVGSPSVANLGRGAGLPESQLVVARPGVPLTFGAFRVTFLPSRHIHPLLAAGRIRHPLRQPAHAASYKEGGLASLLIQHPTGSLLVQESAGYLPGALAGYHADVAFLSLGVLGHRTPRYRRAYFEQLAGALGAQVIYPIHHDAFIRPLDGRPHPWIDRLGGIPPARRSLQAWATAHDVRLAELPPWLPAVILPLPGR